MSSRAEPSMVSAPGARTTPAAPPTSCPSRASCSPTSRPRSRPTSASATCRRASSSRAWRARRRWRASRSSGGTRAWSWSATARRPGSFGRTGPCSSAGRPLETLARQLGRYRAARDPELPPFTGGFLGYFALRRRAPVGAAARPAARRPRVSLSFAWPSWTRSSSSTIGATPCASSRTRSSTRTAAPRPRESAGARAHRPGPRPAPGPPAPGAAGGAGRRSTPRSNWTPEAYCAAVERAQEHIRAGDIYQVILSQRFATPVPGLDPLAIYRALRVVNPSPYMFFLDAGDGATLVGSSPERLVRLEDGRIEMRPLAGTRPRGARPGRGRGRTPARSSPIPRSGPST